MRVSVDHPNDRPNFCRIDIGPVTFWFSYRTCIAFQVPGHLPVIRENDWGPTTGRHLNLIEYHPDPSRRLPSDEFERQLDEAVDRMSYRAGPTIEEIREEFIKELVSG